jgi:hypothetical protein
LRLRRRYFWIPAFAGMTIWAYDELLGAIQLATIQANCGDTMQYSNPVDSDKSKGRGLVPLIRFEFALHVVFYMFAQIFGAVFSFETLF